MQNRRELLVNLVELTITSNTSSVIQFKVGGSTQSFTGTSASIKVEQGKTVEWGVSADGYVSQNGSEVMSGDKEVGISLVPNTVQFTINTNIKATITINGNTSTGVTSKSITVNKGSNVDWSVSADEYATQSGTEAVNNNTTKSISLVNNGVTSQCKVRYIWCTDGSFVDPAKFSSSGKTAYGYALSSSTVVSINRSTGIAWAPSNSPFYKRMYGAESFTDGVANSDYLKAQDGFNPDNCPAIYYACTQTNGGRTSYMPAREEVSTLYASIMSGNMKTDLTTAGIYTICNYRNASGSNGNGVNSGDWYTIWSSSQNTDNSSYAHAWFVDASGSQYYGYYPKYSTIPCVIPFFNF